MDEAGAGRRVHGKAEGADGDFAVVADADAGAEAPDERPPRAGRGRTELGAVFCESLRACGVGSRAEFAVDFVGVGVEEELVEEGVGRFEGEEVVCGELGRETLLPVVVTAFDFAFGLGSGGVAQGDAVEVESFAELGEGVGSVGEEEGVVVHVECEREAVGEEDAGEEVEVREEGLGGVKACAGVVACGVIEDVEEDLLLRRSRQPCVRGCVVLQRAPKSLACQRRTGLAGFL